MYYGGNGSRDVVRISRQRPDHTVRRHKGAKLLKTGSIFEPASTPAASLVDIGNRKQHFLDDQLIDEASRISHYIFKM